MSDIGPARRIIRVEPEKIKLPAKTPAPEKVPEKVRV